MACYLDESVLGTRIPRRLRHMLTSLAAHQRERSAEFFRKDNTAKGPCISHWFSFEGDDSLFTLHSYYMVDRLVWHMQRCVVLFKLNVKREGLNSPLQTISAAFRHHHHSDQHLSFISQSLLHSSGGFFARSQDSTCRSAADTICPARMLSRISSPPTTS